MNAKKLQNENKESKSQEFFKIGISENHVVS